MPKLLLKEEKTKDKTSKEYVKELKKWIDDEDTEKWLKKQKAHIQKLEKGFKKSLILS